MLMETWSYFVRQRQYIRIYTQACLVQEKFPAVSFHIFYTSGGSKNILSVSYRIWHWDKQLCNSLRDKAPQRKLTCCAMSHSTHDTVFTQIAFPIESSWSSSWKRSLLNESNPHRCLRSVYRSSCIHEIELSLTFNLAFFLFSNIWQCLHTLNAFQPAVKIKRERGEHCLVSCRLLFTREQSLCFHLNAKNSPDTIVLKAAWHLLKWAPLFINCKSILMIEPPPLLFLKLMMSHSHTALADMQDCIQTTEHVKTLTLNRSLKKGNICI